MERRNLHMHSTFSDGKNTLEEMTEEAIRLGFTRIGFSDHSYLSFDPDFCMPYERYDAYKQEVRALRERFRDQIEIFCGIEQDYYSDFPAEGFDYVIGSVHYIEQDGAWICTDWGREEGTRILTEAAQTHFGGDIYALLERYFETVADVVRKTGADIVGHFDVIAKSNRDFPFFDPAHPRYIAAWKQAADRLLSEQVMFEINASPMLNGFLDEAHPAKPIEAYLRENGARLLYTGDSHSIQQLQAFRDYLQTVIL